MYLYTSIHMTLEYVADKKKINIFMSKTRMSRRNTKKNIKEKTHKNLYEKPGG